MRLEVPSDREIAQEALDVVGFLRTAAENSLKIWRLRVVDLIVSGAHFAGAFRILAHQRIQAPGQHGERLVRISARSEAPQ